MTIEAFSEELAKMQTPNGERAWRIAVGWAKRMNLTRKLSFCQIRELSIAIKDALEEPRPDAEGRQG